MLSMTRPRFDVEKSNVRKYILGAAVPSDEESGPKKIKVGWVILIVPRLVLALVISAITLWLTLEIVLEKPAK